MPIDSPIHQFPKDFGPDQIQLFPKDIEDNLRVAYHGSTSAFEDQIIRSGLKGLQLFSKQDMRGMVGIFESMKWAGTTLGGLCVLQTYSLKHDWDTFED